MSYFIIDTEITIKNRGENAIGNCEASSFHPDNKLVAVGWKNSRDITIEIGDMWSIQKWKSLGKDTILVGHNVKFDLLWLRRINPDLINEWLKTAQIWDTQLVEYLLSGQSHHFPSLDEIAPKYGGTLKDDRIKSMWKAGIDTDEMPVELLKEYLRNDVLNTEIVFLKQLETAKKYGMFSLIQTQMRALLATFEMEYNGMKFDQEIASSQARELEASMNHLENIIYLMMAEHFVKGYDINPSSNQQISLVLFGGSYEHNVKESFTDIHGDLVYYKSGARAGTLKERFVTYTHETKGLGFVPRNEWKTKTKGIYQTGEEILNHFKEHHEFVENLLKFRGMSKDLNTYYKGYIGMVWSDGCIHGNIHHCSTDTGRLSSSNPNLQNLTRSEV